MKFEVDKMSQKITVYTTNNDPFFNELLYFLEDHINQANPKDILSIKNVATDMKAREHLLTYGIEYLPVVEFKDHLVVGMDKNQLLNQMERMKLS